jgi:hypothetical protein
VRLICKGHERQGLTLCSTRIAPTHIAFAADDRTQVRDCYTNALKAGGRPSGAPSYRNNECSCFNAAVEDLDGNTIEFIFRENGPCHEEPSHADEEHSRVLTWQDGVAREADAASVASRAKSTVPYVAAPEAEAEVEAEPAAEAPSTSKGAGTFISALSSGITPKGVLGGVIGAVAVGAIGYAFYQSEQDSARAEAAHEALMAELLRTLLARNDQCRLHLLVRLRFIGTTALRSPSLLPTVNTGTSVSLNRELVRVLRQRKSQLKPPQHCVPLKLVPTIETVRYSLSSVNTLRATRMRCVCLKLVRRTMTTRSKQCSVGTLHATQQKAVHSKLLRSTVGAKLQH